MYFQAIDNGRRRRCVIPLLWDGDHLIKDPMDIRVHVDGFYTQLFSEVTRGGTSLTEHI